MIFFTKGENKETLIVRTLQDSDFPALLNYWYNPENQEYFWSLGIDQTLLPSRTQRQRNFHCNIGNTEVANGTFFAVIEYKKEPAGYFLCNQFKTANNQQSCQGHVHILNESDRRKGLLSEVFLDGLRYLKMHNMADIVIFEPCAENAGINDFLSKFNISPESTQVKEPQGICRKRQINKYTLELDLLLDSLMTDLNN